MNEFIIVSKVITCSIFGWWVLWVIFLAVMALKRAKDDGKITPNSPAYNIGLSVLIVGYLCDFLINIGPATILFLELPQEKTVTERCRRLLFDDGWRGAIAHWLCSNLLDPFQIGGHCK